MIGAHHESPVTSPLAADLQGRGSSSGSIGSGGSPACAAIPCSAMSSPISDNDKIDTRALVMNLVPVSERQIRSNDPDLRPHRKRDLVLFGTGALASTLLMLLCNLGSHASASAPVQAAAPSLRSSSEPCAALLQEDRSLRHPRMALAEPGPSKFDVPGGEASRKYAYVMMAYDAPGERPHYIWRAIALIRSLQRLSRYPVLLLTNTTHLPDGTSVNETFGRLNAQVLPVHEVPLPKKIEKEVMPVWRVAYWKLQIWRFTQYEKLIWLDTDAIMVRSIDWLFDRTPMWGQRDAWVCSNDAHFQDWLCSGLMLIEPSEKVYQGLLEYAGTAQTKWWENGDQKLIGDYYRHIVGKPVQLLNLTEAAFGKCLGIVPNLYNETPGELWNLPAFVHKSSVHNECFYFLIAKQLRKVGGTMENTCHYHPLGSHWRDAFCDGLRLVGAKTDVTDAFCDDFLWYRHR